MVVSLPNDSAAAAAKGRSDRGLASSSIRMSLNEEPIARG